MLIYTHAALIVDWFIKPSKSEKPIYQLSPRARTSRRAQSVLIGSIVNGCFRYSFLLPLSSLFTCSWLSPFFQTLQTFILWPTHLQEWCLVFQKKSLLNWRITSINNLPLPIPRPSSPPQASLHHYLPSNFRVYRYRTNIMFPILSPRSAQASLHLALSQVQLRYIKKISNGCMTWKTPCSRTVPEVILMKSDNRTHRWDPRWIRLFHALYPHLDLNFRTSLKTH